MEYKIYKMNFTTGVHFGEGNITTAGMSFYADTLFSSLCHEALHRGQGEMERLVRLVQSGKILFSDGMPYIIDSKNKCKEFFVAKPLVMIESDPDDNSEKKKWKKVQYIPISKIDEYLAGKMNVESDFMKEFGCIENRNMVGLQNPEKSEPYVVGVYHFNSNVQNRNGEEKGLYTIIGYEKEEDCTFVLNLLDELGIDGFGGKKGAGLGKYEGLPEEVDENLKRRLTQEGEYYVSVTTSIPREDELEEILKDAATLLVKRSGFVFSGTYADRLLKKKDMYFFQSGSVFGSRYAGDIYDVSGYGNHPVWRYSKPLFLALGKAEKL